MSEGKAWLRPQSHSVSTSKRSTKEAFLANKGVLWCGILLLMLNWSTRSFKGRKLAKRTQILKTLQQTCMCLMTN